MSKIIYGGRILQEGIGTPLIPCKGGYVSNLGISLSSGLFKIVQANGQDCSPTKEGHICMPSQANPGQFVNLKVTDTSHNFTDDVGTSNIVGNNFSSIAGIIWDFARPFYLYVVNSDDTDSGLYFMLSLSPVLQKVTTTQNNMAYHGVSAISNSPDTEFYLTSTNIKGIVDGSPCMRVGCITMTKTTLDDWTVAALDDKTGIGRSHQGRLFTMVLGQNEAGSGLITGTNGPSWTINERGYKIDDNGMCRVEYGFRGSCTNGSNGSTTRIHLPYYVRNTAPSQVAGVDELQYAGSRRIPYFQVTSGQSYFTVYYYSSLTAINGTTYNGWTSGGDEFRTDLIFKAFLG